MSGGTDDGGPFVIRRLAPTDSLADLTTLLNRAYRQLLEMGLRYVATWQDEAITRRRIEGAECWVAEQDGRIVGTITLYPPGRGKGHPFYERDDVAKIGQFGIEPGLQGTGLGSRMMDHVERRARELGATELAGDTAVPAAHLHAFYAARGYREIGRIRWDTVNYESVIRSKALGARGHHHADCDRDVRAWLDRVTDAYRARLGRDLVAVWLVGSLAFGCWNRALSDLDLLVVVERRPDPDVLRALARDCVSLTDERPTLGDQETSVVTAGVLAPLRHPTPHVFQYSADWTERFRSTGFEPYDGEADPDIVTHAAVALRCGVVLHGAAPTQIVGGLRWTDFRASLLDDLRWIVAADHLATTPVYGVLNLCRIVMAFTEGDGTVASKLEGAGWALANVPEEHRPVVRRARDAYVDTVHVEPAAWRTAGRKWDTAALEAFAAWARSRVPPAG